MAAKTEALMVRMSAQTRAKLQALADDEDRSTVNMIERLISLAYRELQDRDPGRWPDDPVIVDGQIVSESSIGEG